MVALDCRSQPHNPPKDKAGSRFSYNLGKIWLILSIVLSAVFINAYLGHFNTPFVPIDDVFPMILQVFSLSFVYTYGSTVMYLLASTHFEVFSLAQHV